MRLLGLERHTHAQVDLIIYIAQLHVGIVSMLRAFGVAAEVLAKIRLVGVVQISEERRPRAVVVQHTGKRLVAEVGEVVSRRIVLLVTVPIAVVELQEESLLSEGPRATAAATTTTASAAKGTAHLRHTCCRLFLLTSEEQQGLRIGDTQRVAQLVVCRGGIAVGLIGGVFARLRLLLIQVDGRQTGILVAAVAPAELRAECDVAPVRPQSAVYLQLSVDVLVVVISQSFVLSAVDYQSLLVHLPQALGTQRVSDIVVGIAVEGCRCREVATVAGLETHIRAERQRRYRVDGPLQIHVARPVVVARIVLTDAVREGSATRIDKVLRSRLVPVVGVATRPRHSPTPLHLLVFVAGIQRCRLRLALTLVVAATTSATS